MSLQIVGRERRKLRIRTKVNGTPERPRMTVFRSNAHIYAQVIDDVAGKTLAHSSTLAKDVKPQADDTNKSEAAKLVGKTIAAQLKAKGVTKIVFDRNGYIYHGRIKALADGAREGGLEF
ncbi:MAG: 50S ribosomal protein L18 [Labilithrix sp.]|nr:50S ribosomal protein L18 [Labilithrix sp.]MCW5817613.1 50S ribosomal protein L18 [Labilithrix sp.]